MPAGLRVFNDANTIVIDQDSTSFVLHSKGTVTTSTPPADFLASGSTNWLAYYCTSFAQITIPGAPQRGTFAIRCTANVANITFGYPIINGTAASMRLGCEGAAGTTIEWFYFCPVSELPPSGVSTGLSVWNATGSALAFDSGYRAIKYVDFLSGSGSAVGGPYTYTAGRNYALIVSAGGFRYTGKSRGSNRYDFVHAGVGGRVSSNSIYTTHVLGSTDGATSIIGGVTGSLLTRPWGVIVVDVTGM